MHWIIRHRQTLQYLETYVQGHGVGRHWTDDGDKAKAFDEEPAAAAVITAEGIGHMTEVIAWPGITIMMVGLARLAAKGKAPGDSLSMTDFESVNLAMLGGCHGCGESLAAYNAYPDDATGCWACKGCLRKPYATVAEFEEAIAEQSASETFLNPEDDPTWG